MELKVFLNDFNIIRSTLDAGSRKMAAAMMKIGANAMWVSRSMRNMVGPFVGVTLILRTVLLARP